MTLAADTRVLWQLVRGLSGPGTHRTRLQRFYAPQAEHYDAFRERLLCGRRELVERLPAPAGGRVIELGGGTARNLEYFGCRLDGLAEFEIVDLCPALLEIARRRVAGRPNVSLIEADAAEFRPAAPADCVYFAYSLTMMPDWQCAVDGALEMLRPGGALGIVDFYVSEARPAPGLTRHGPLTRAFWRRWFRRDGVKLCAAHLPYIRARTDEIHLEERRARIPYLPGLTVPYYLFVGRKREATPRREG
jgi:S-adenosylmethionine-diacylgycerolhomoserine-N-methlytransferase